MAGLKDFLSKDNETTVTGMMIPPGLAHHHRKGTESTMSSSPPVEIEESTSSHYTATTHGVKFLSTTSSPPSPSGEKNHTATTKEVIAATKARSSAFPSPIGKPQQHQHPLLSSSRQTSTTSPSLTLTPNSTTDGSNFVISPDGVNFQPALGASGANAAAAFDGPSMPYLYANSATHAFQASLADGNSSTGSVIHHHRRGESSSFGSFDLGGGETGRGHITDDLNDDNDGLFGLEALHYRVASHNTTDTSSSTATPSQSSPRTTRRNAYNPDSTSSSGLQPRRSSTHSDRPPLSQYSYGESNNPTSGSYGKSSQLYESPMTGFGTIGQLRLNAAEFDPSRRRSSSDYNNPTAPIAGYNEQQLDVSQKFGTLPTLGSHIHQQSSSNSRNIGFGDLSKPRHTRSISQPGPPGMGSISGVPPAVLPHDSRFYDGTLSSYDGKSNSLGYGSRGGGGSMAQQHVPSGSSYDPSYGNSKVVGMSMPNLGYSQSSSGYNSSGYTSLEQGFDDFHVSPESQSNAPSYLNGFQSESTYGRNGRLSSSPGQNPHQYFYGNNDGPNRGGHHYHHVRQQSENTMHLSSSQSLPMGLSTSLPRLDDDLTHPLVGENIDVPEYDDQHGLPAYLMSNGSGGSHPLLRGATHSHSMSLDAIPTQQFMPPSAPKVVYVVKFKRSQRNFLLGPRISRDLKIGTYVKVEADRGEDLGIVVGKLPPEKFSGFFSSRSSFTAGMGGPPPIGSSLVDLKRIMRLATRDEVSLLGLKREEEEELLKICRTKVRQRGLPMNVVDAEYQFDRHKLTFFFEAMGRVDFRELVRDLFSMYKTRIWMQQLDKNTSTSAQAIVFPTANLQMDYGTPIIAPTSEFADSIYYGQGNNISCGGGDFE
jgi:PSP1 C-terminal conserved region